MRNTFLLTVAFAAILGASVPPSAARADVPVACQFQIPQFIGFPKADSGGKYAFDLLAVSPQKDELSGATVVRYRATFRSATFASRELDGTARLSRTVASDGFRRKHSTGVQYIWMVAQFLVPTAATDGYFRGDWSCTLQAVAPASGAAPGSGSPANPEGGSGGSPVRPKPVHVLE